MSHHEGPLTAAADARARERRERRRSWLRPLGGALVVMVAVASIENRPPPGIHGAGLGVTVALAAYVAGLVSVLLPGWTRQTTAFQVATIAMAAAGGVTLAGLQPHGPVELAPSAAVWLAVVRLPRAWAAALAAATTAVLTAVVATTQHPAAQAVGPPILLCLLLTLMGHFMRSSHESQDRSDLLLAELQDAREAEAEAIATVERGRIASELHDVLAHSLSGLSIQLEGARKLAEREGASQRLRELIGRSGELAHQGLADARRAVGALKGDQLPTLDQIENLVSDCRRDLKIDVTFRVDGTPRPLPPEASLALYRGTEEALTNVARHAPRSVTTVTLCYLQRQTRLRIQDTIADPDGPQPSSPLAGMGGGQGLAGMRERMVRAGGSMHAGSTGGGWLVELEVPA